MNKVTFMGKQAVSKMGQHSRVSEMMRQNHWLSALFCKHAEPVHGRSNAQPMRRGRIIAHTSFGINIAALGDGLAPLPHPDLTSYPFCRTLVPWQTALA